MLIWLSFLSHFVAQLVMEGLSAGTVKSYLSAVRHPTLVSECDPNIPNIPIQVGIHYQRVSEDPAILQLARGLGIEE